MIANFLKILVVIDFSNMSSIYKNVEIFLNKESWLNENSKQQNERLDISAIKKEVMKGQS